MDRVGQFKLFVNLILKISQKKKKMGKKFLWVSWNPLNPIFPDLIMDEFILSIPLSRRAIFHGTPESAAFSEKGEVGQAGSTLGTYGESNLLLTLNK